MLSLVILYFAIIIGAMLLFETLVPAVARVFVSDLGIEINYIGVNRFCNNIRRLF